MTPQERELITTLLGRLKGASGQPKDPEADALIRQAIAEQPDAPYYLVQTVLIQDLSLHQAQNQIADLERQLAEANAAKSSGTSFLGGLFGSRPSPAAAPSGSVPSAGPWARGPQVAPPQPPPGPGYAQPGYAQPGPAAAGAAGGLMGAMGGAGGGGFLRSAAATAAGIAGGALLFQGISSMFGHGYANSLNGGMGMTPGLGDTVVNNYYGDSGGSAGGDYGGGGDAGYAGGGGDYGGGGDAGGGTDYASGGDYGGGGDSGGGDFGGGGGDSSA
jgi:hypothetical protein